MLSITGQLVLEGHSEFQIVQMLWCVFVVVVCEGGPPPLPGRGDLNATLWARGCWALHAIVSDDGIVFMN